jgi:hypothetical protein
MNCLPRISPLAAARLSAPALSTISHFTPRLLDSDFFGWIINKLLKAYLNFSVSWFVTALFAG